MYPPKVSFNTCYYCNGRTVVSPAMTVGIEIEILIRLHKASVALTYFDDKLEYVEMKVIFKYIKDAGSG